MQLHQLNPTHKPRKGRRIGRGGKKGTYSGKGIKGQKSRAGRKMKPWIREIIKRYPKLRGYRQKSKFKNQNGNSAILNLDVLEKKFNEGDKVSPEILVEKGIIGKIQGRVPKVKILGKGKITKKLIIEGCQLSQNVKKIISTF